MRGRLGEGLYSELARALATQPKVLLLDEPLAAIDEQFREEMRWELRHLQRELGTTTIHVTHDREEAMVMADRLVIMYAGRVVERAPVDELFAHPLHAYTRGLLDSASSRNSSLPAP